MSIQQMSGKSIHRLEGRQVSVALRHGDRIDDCQLVSGPRAGADTLWLFSQGRDMFVPLAEVLDIWEVAVTHRAA